MTDPAAAQGVPDGLAEAARLKAEEIRAEAVKLAHQWGVSFPRTGVTSTATYANALVAAAFTAGYDYHQEMPDANDQAAGELLRAEVDRLTGVVAELRDANERWAQENADLDHVISTMIRTLRERKFVT